MSPVCPEPPDPRSDLDPTLDASTLSARSPDLTSPHSPSQPPQRIGDYVIIGKLGEGGMGVVYEAEQQHPKRRVALKVVRGGHFVSEIEIRMFEREAETLARLKHPNIAAIHESGRTEEGQHFFAMELVRGETLDAYAKRHAQASVRERLRLFRQICEAVNYAHQRGVIHRDLKPSNIVVVEEEAAAVRSGTGAGSSTTHIPAVKILDFGLARITDADAAASIVSEVGAIKGTLPYMSPEQARGNPEEIDLRTDVYALGVILYQLLAGSLPYDTQKASILEAARVICEEAPRPIRAGGRDIDADLETVVLKALEKEPDLRYQSAGALADDVERYLSNQPILAHPPSTMYQVRKLVARHKGRVVALGAIAALLVALTATMIVQAGRVRDERDRATAEAAKSGAINQFLIDALGGADPWGRGSRSISLLDALHQARAKAHTSFGSQPLVEASVLQTLGTTFGSLAEFAAGDTALRSALDLSVAKAGDRSDESAEALSALAVLHLRWGKYDEAEKLAREALDITSELHGATSLEAAAIMNDLATALSKEARLAEAKALAEQSLQIARENTDASRNAQGGTVDPGRVEIQALNVLGEIALNEDDGKAMERIEQERLALVRSRTPGQNAELALALNGLATAQVVNGNLEGAERTYQDAIEMARAVFGDDHPEVAIYLENLGNVYYRAGKLDQTASNLELVLAMRRKALGDDSEPVARTLANMAVIYRASGKNEAAERSYREAVERLTRKLGPEHPDVGITMAGLGDVLRRQGKYVESESTLRHALAILVKANGEDHVWTQRALEMLASLYTEWKKPAQAAEYNARLAPQK